jgi:hypothetical protein
MLTQSGVGHCVDPLAVRLLRRWNKPLQYWLERRMSERFSRVEQLELQVQMLLGAFSAKGVLSLEFKPAYCVGGPLTQHLGELEKEAQRKGGVTRVLEDHFARVFATARQAAQSQVIWIRRSRPPMAPWEASSRARAVDHTRAHRMTASDRSQPLGQVKRPDHECPGMPVGLAPGVPVGFAPGVPVGCCP